MVYNSNPSPMARVAVGGTFDPLHDGHRAVLMKACVLSRGGELAVGLTSDEMVRNKVHEVDDYGSRHRRIVDFFRTLGITPRITRLDDPCGPTIHEDFDFLVVSPETHSIALKINRIRREKGLKEIKIVLVDYVLAEDGIPISSTRIKKGEIDGQGKLLK